MTLRILGIDPGSRRTGVGIVDSLGGRLVHVHHSVVQTQDEDFPTRLRDIYEGVQERIARYRPAVCAVETVFLSRNPQSALKLGQARGAAIVAAVGAGLPVVQYTPGQIKQAVVGSGGADKTQVAFMVQLLLRASLPDGLGDVPNDASDALAAAITHAHHHESADRLGLPAVRGRRR